MALSTSTKKVLFVAGVLIVLAGASFAFLELTHRTDVLKKPSTIKNQREEQQANDKQKQDYLDNAPTTSVDKDGNTVINNDYRTPVNNDGIELSVKQADGNVVVSTKLSGYSDGKCTLTVTNGAKVITKEADILYQPENSTCMGFSIPVTQGGSGTWNIKLKVSSADTTNEKVTLFEVK